MGRQCLWVDNVYGQTMSMGTQGWGGRPVTLHMATTARRQAAVPACHFRRWVSREMGGTPGLGRFPGEGNGNPLQHSRLGNPMKRGAWWAAVHGVTKSQDTIEQNNNKGVTVTHLRDISESSISRGHGDIQKSNCPGPWNYCNASIMY